MVYLGRVVTLRQIISRSNARLVLFAVSFVSVLLMGSGFVVMRGYAACEIRLIADSVSYAVEPAVVFGDRDAIRRGMLESAETADLNAIEVAGIDGQVLARWQAATDSRLARFGRRVGTLLWPTPMTRLVEHDGRVLAQVRVYGGAGAPTTYLALGLVFSAASLILTFLATDLLARRLQNDVVRPLAHLAEVARSVREDRAFDRRVGVSGIAEIDELAGHFDALLGELAAWHRGLTRENERLERQARYDELTGLGNRGLFEVTLGASLAAARREAASFAVLYVDVDDFKRVNDVHGHAAGDIVLRSIALRLRREIREGDAAFRLGGDEFAVVLAAPVDRAGVDGIAGRISSAATHPIMLSSGQAVVAHVSVGVALHPDDGADTAELMEAADGSMYRNKRMRRSASGDLVS